MNITLNTQEAEKLKRILTSYLSDLRMEISDTDRMDFRDSLKQDEVLLKRVLRDLGSDWVS